MKHEIEWLTPAPLWDLALEDAGRTRFRQPALLRFASEGFIDDLTGVLESEPGGIQGRVARPETWEQPVAGWVAAGDASLAAPLKLFQPSQSRFYLVASSLVCRRTGLPERKVDVAAEERASMVVRRLVPIAGVTFDPDDSSTYTEHAWIGDREAGAWQNAEVRTRVLDGEERLPLFNMTYRHEGLERRLQVGSVPVSGRELYEGRPPAGGPVVELDDSLPGDPLLALEDPRKAAWIDGPGEALGLYALTENLGDPGELQEMSPEDARELLTFTLLDMADFFALEMAALWDAIEGGSSAGLGADEAAVYTRLGQLLSAGNSWRQALVAADQQRAALYGEVDPDPTVDPPFPDTLDRDDIADAAADLVNGTGGGDPPLLHDLVFDALDGIEPSGETPPGGAMVDAAAAAAASAGEGSFYGIRFVYERPRCKSFVDAVVGPLSRPFRMAPFYDPEAPARPVTIRMPVDTSIRGLSRFPKSVGMVISNKLRQQVERVQEATLEQVDDGEIGQGSSWGIGMICSLSIPIISLCALIVLMIFIQLLNIVFWWIPFLRICLPIPVRND